jgi:hypothetical protein
MFFLSTFVSANAPIPIEHLEPIKQMQFFTQSGSKLPGFNSIKVAPEGLYITLNTGIFMLADKETGKSIKEIDNIMLHMGGIFLTPKHIYLGVNDRIRVMNRRNWHPVRTYRLPVVNGYQTEPRDFFIRGDLAYITGYDNVIVYNLKLKKVTRIIPLPLVKSVDRRKFPVWGVDLMDHFLFLTHAEPSCVFRYDLKSNKFLKFEDGAYRASEGVSNIPQVPKGVRVSNGLVYVSNELNGIAVFDAATGRAKKYIHWNGMWSQALDIYEDQLFVENAVLKLPSINSCDEKLK